MNILYIDHYAGSIYHGRSFRPYYLGREWCQKGNKLTVVGAIFSHLRSKQPKNSKENIDGIDYIWLKTPSYKGNGIKRVLSMFVFTFQLFWNMRKIIKVSHPDVVIASTVYLMDIYPAWLMAKITGAKLVFELHDIWPMTLTELGGFSKYNPFVLFMGATEWVVYKVSDHVVSILPQAYKRAHQFNVKPDAFTYVPNGVVLADWIHESHEESVHQEVSAFVKDFKFVVGYTGSMGISNYLDNLIAAGKILEKEKIGFVIIGDGPEKNKLQLQAQGANNIKFVERISKTQLAGMYKYFDLCFASMKDSPLYEYGVGLNKMYDYMMAEKPVLLAIPRGVEFLEEVGCAFILKSQTPEELGKEILRISKLEKNILKNMGETGKKYVTQNHNYQKLAADFLKICA